MSSWILGRFDFSRNDPKIKPAKTFNAEVSLQKLTEQNYSARIEKYLAGNSDYCLSMLRTIVETLNHG